MGRVFSFYFGSRKR